MKNNVDNFFQNYEERVKVHFKALLFDSLKRSKEDLDHVIERSTVSINRKSAHWTSYNNPYVARASAYEAKGDLENAIKDYDSAIREFPEDDMNYYLRGKINGVKGDYDRAITDFETSFAKSSGEDGVDQFLTGLAYLGKGDFNRALIDCDKALAGMQGDHEIGHAEVQAYLIRGFLHGRNGDYEKAIADFKAVLQNKPNQRYVRYGQYDNDRGFREYAQHALEVLAARK